MKSSLTLLFVMTFSSMALAHAGHGEDPVHYVAGIDWWIAVGFIAITIGLGVFAWVRSSRKRRGV